MIKLTETINSLEPLDAIIKYIGKNNYIIIGGLATALYLGKPE